MADQVVPFTFRQAENETPIRVLIFDGEPWFVGADVCNAIDIEPSAHRHAFERLDPGEKGVQIMHTPGGPQQMVIISEPGLYRLVGRAHPSRPQVKAVQDWIFGVVIPSLRKGDYQTLIVSPQPDLLTQVNRITADLLSKVEATVRRAVKDTRKNFGKAAERYACEGLANYGNCECIYCNEAKVVSKFGVIRDNAQLHHGDGNARNPAADNCVVSCDDCHDRITYKNRPDHIPHYLAIAKAMAFHDMLRQKTRQINAPKSDPATFWDFRTAVQTDMGFSEQRKREAE